MNTTLSCNESLKHAGLSWEEAIRLDAVTEEHILEMQEIIINQEGIIEDLETRIQDTERLLNSFDFVTVDILLDSLGHTVTGKDMDTLVALTKIINNYKLRTHNEQNILDNNYSIISTW